MDTSLIETLGSGGAQIILAAGVVVLGVAYWREKTAHDKTRADHAQMQRDDLTNILNTTGQVTAALKSVERAVFGRSGPDV